jgi:hypothetical protein
MQELVCAVEAIRRSDRVPHQHGAVEIRVSRSGTMRWRAHDRAADDDHVIGRRRDGRFGKTRRSSETSPRAARVERVVDLVLRPGHRPRAPSASGRDVAQRQIALGPLRSRSRSPGRRSPRHRGSHHTRAAVRARIACPCRASPCRRRARWWSARRGRPPRRPRAGWCTRSNMAWMSNSCPSRAPTSMYWPQPAPRTAPRPRCRGAAPCAR